MYYSESRVDVFIKRARTAPEYRSRGWFRGEEMVSEGGDGVRIIIDSYARGSDYYMAEMAQQHNTIVAQTISQAVPTIAHVLRPVPAIQPIPQIQEIGYVPNRRPMLIEG